MRLVKKNSALWIRFTVGVFSAILGAALTASLFLWIAAGEIYDYTDSFDLLADIDVDAVICPAGGKGRIAAAAETWNAIRMEREKLKMPPPVFFLSGTGANADYNTLEDQQIPRTILSELRVAPVYFEDVSENTFENAKIFSSYVRQHQWKKVLLVTSGYHMRRAQFILRKALDYNVLVKTKTADAAFFDRNSWRKDSYSMRVTLLEYLKWLYYRYSY